MDISQTALFSNGHKKGGTFVLMAISQRVPFIHGYIKVKRHFILMNVRQTPLFTNGHKQEGTFY